jgi:glucose 1-dehydrogenase
MDLREHAEFLRPRTGGQPLAGQQALVIGANSGIGKAVAFALADAGATVAVNYLVGEDEAQSIVDGITAAGGQAIALCADASSEEQVETMFEHAVAAFGTLDIVANAGLQRDAPFEELTLAQWNTVINVNLTGQFL